MTTPAKNVTDGTTTAGALEAVRRHFPEPSDTVVKAWRPDSLLDADGLDEAALEHGPRPAAALALLSPPHELQAAVRSS